MDYPIKICTLLNKALYIIFLKQISHNLQVTFSGKTLKRFIEFFRISTGDSHDSTHF